MLPLGDSWKVQLVLFLSLLAGSCSANRSLQQDGNVECGVFLARTDVPGENLPGSGTITASNQECLQLCMGTATCNALVRFNGNGACFVKSVSPDVEPFQRNRFTSYIICDATSPAPAPSPTPAPAPAPDPAPGATGQFGPVIQFPLVSVAAANLPDGKVLVWSGAEVDDFGGGVAGRTFYALFDPATDSVGPLQNVIIDHDMFCPGVAVLPNGDVVVVGGSVGGDGAGATTIWSGNSFTRNGNLNINRGYNTAVLLANGDVFTLGGSFSGTRRIDKGGEILSNIQPVSFPLPIPPPIVWRETTNIEADPILSDDSQGVFRTDNYPHLFAWTGDSVFHAGPSIQMNWFTNLDGEGTVTPAGNRGPTAMNGNAVMYEEGKILVVGGAPTYSLGDAARSGAEIITLGAVNSPPNVRQVPAPAIERTYCMAVPLPTGEVAHFGGATTSVEFSDDTAVLSTEIWNPETETWRTDASSAIPRTYHSSAVLVPDGRVFVGGSGFCGECGVNHLNAEMYSPAYLFNEDGSASARPTISLSASSVAPGGSITVSGSEALSMVAMLRMGGTTHSTNTDQRRLELCGPSSTACGGASASVSVPGIGIAIPGNWMVFGINAAGVPSVASTLQVT